MRKKIAIFLGDVTSSMQEIIIRRIISRANELNYDTVLLCTFGSYNDDILYSDGERAFIYLADYTRFSGIIIAEDLLDISGMKDELYNKVISGAKCPIVYLRTIRDGCYSVLTHNEKVMEDMTRHFVVDHGFRDICYMSGKQGHLDTEERLQGFLNVMQEYNLPINKNTIFHGDYWREKGAQAVDWFMKDRKKYPQAIICANDYMALSVCDELRNRGVRVPEDVCVSGFDYVDEAKHHKPSITSISVDFADMAADAVDIIDRVIKGDKVDKLNYHEAKIYYHNSCCGEQHELGDLANIIEENYLNKATAKKMMLSVMEYQDAFGEDEYLGVAEKYHSIVNTDKMWVCICDTEEQGFSSVENDTKFSKKMILKRIFYKDKPSKKLNEVFDRVNLMPDEYWSEDKYNNYMLFCIHFKNKVYGYVGIEIPKKGWLDIFMQAYYINLANAIENGIIQKELSNLEELESLCYKDTLTGIFNRRGFDKLLREKYDEARQGKLRFAVVSIDMDGLKVINDSFGHDEGDAALTGLSTALKNAISDKDSCARVGGDEFYAYLETDSYERILEFKQKFYDEIEKIKPEIKGGVFGASMGVCEFSEKLDAPLVWYLKTADTRMYENKRLRKEMGRD